MRRWAGLLFVTIASAVIFFARTSEAPLAEYTEAVRAEPSETITDEPAPVEPAGPSPDTPTDTVRVEYDLVEIAPPVPRRVPVRRPVAARQANVREEPSEVPLVVRAGRVLIGDGRYRPEPFPRPHR